MSKLSDLGGHEIHGYPVDNNGNPFRSSQSCKNCIFFTLNFIKCKKDHNYRKEFGDNINYINDCIDFKNRYK